MYILYNISQVSLCIHAFGMTFIGARETRCGNIPEPEAAMSTCVSSSISCFAYARMSLAFSLFLSLRLLPEVSLPYSYLNLC